MTITQISPRLAAQGRQVRLGPGAAAQRARRASTRSSARPGIGVLKKGKNAEAAADFLAFFTNPANSAKLAQPLPAAAQVAAQRRDAGARPTRCSSRSSCRQVVIDGISTGVGQAQPHAATPRLQQTVRAALDPLWKADAADVKAGAATAVAARSISPARWRTRAAESGVLRRATPRRSGPSRRDG